MTNKEETSFWDSISNQTVTTVCHTGLSLASLAAISVLCVQSAMQESKGKLPADNTARIQQDEILPAQNTLSIQYPSNYDSSLEHRYVTEVHSVLASSDLYSQTAKEDVVQAMDVMTIVLISEDFSKEEELKALNGEYKKMYHQIDNVDTFLQVLKERVDYFEQKTHIPTCVKTASNTFFKLCDREQSRTYA